MRLQRSSISSQPAVVSATATVSTSRLDGQALTPTRRNWYLATFIGLTVLLVMVISAGIYYWQTHRAVSSLPVLQAMTRNVAPRFLFNIYKVAGPVGLALNAKGDRVFVTESEGERLIRVLDRNGNYLYAFSPPGSDSSNRSPLYLTLDDRDRVYVVDRLQHAINIYTEDGQFVESMIGPDQFLKGWAARNGGFDYLTSNSTFVFRPDRKIVEVQSKTGQFVGHVPSPAERWSPMGISFAGGTFYVTDSTKGQHRVFMFDRDLKLIGEFGKQGNGPGDFWFPNKAMTDKAGNIYITDGNNGRVQVFKPTGIFSSTLGSGWSLPRGMALDDQDRIYVVDTIGQSVQTHDLRTGGGFLFSIGRIGYGDGQFTFPSDLAVEPGGRLYIADRQNNRIQVWSY